MDLAGDALVAEGARGGLFEGRWEGSLGVCELLFGIGFLGGCASLPLCSDFEVGVVWFQDVSCQHRINDILESLKYFR